MKCDAPILLSYEGVTKRDHPFRIMKKVIYVLPKEKEEHNMEIMCLVADRKELVAAIENLSGKMKYQGPPSFAYANEVVTVLSDGI